MIEYRVTDDEVYVMIPNPEYGKNVCQTKTIMTREAFVECYKKWILKDRELAKVTSGDSGYPYAMERLEDDFK